MKTTYRLLFGILIVYTLTILWIEWQYGQSIVRFFLTDVKCNTLALPFSTPFYAVNTILSTFFLWATALIFGLCLLLVNKLEENKEYWFCLSQILIFTYLGFDEQFLLHERIGAWLGRNDAYLLLGLGIVELGLLFKLGQLSQRPPKIRNFLFTAAILFGCMIVIDALLPSSKLQFRLSLEDLSKLWADVFLFLFGFEIFLQKLRNISHQRLS